MVADHNGDADHVKFKQALQNSTTDRDLQRTGNRGRRGPEAGSGTCGLVVTLSPSQQRLFVCILSKGRAPYLKKASNSADPFTSGTGCKDDPSVFERVTRPVH